MRRVVAAVAAVVAGAVAVERIDGDFGEERWAASKVEEWSIDVGVAVEVATAAVGASGIAIAEAFGDFVAW